MLQTIARTTSKKPMDGKFPPVNCQGCSIISRSAMMIKSASIGWAQYQSWFSIPALNETTLIIWQICKWATSKLLKISDDLPRSTIYSRVRCDYRNLNYALSHRALPPMLPSSGTAYIDVQPHCKKMIELGTYLLVLDLYHLYSKKLCAISNIDHSFDITHHVADHREHSRIGLSVPLPYLSCPCLAASGGIPQQCL
jgi:hypothetical protein